MRFEELTLRNFKCFPAADCPFRPGVTVIHGPNGSGKTSLLEACFFALYGSPALPGTLDDIITSGTEETEIDLEFRHGGIDHHIHRRIRLSGDRAQTADCTLETADRLIEGATDVAEYVTDLLHMDAEAFVNCAYVRQGEINKLIQASPSERQDMIDELMQLGTLETYRSRAREASLGVGDLRNDIAGQLREIEAQIDRKTEQNLTERLNELETELGAVEDRREHLDEQRELAEQRRSEAEELLSSLEETKEERESLEERIQELRSTIEETESKRESALEQIDSRRERIRAARDRAAELGEELGMADPTPTGTESEIETTRDRLDSIREEIQEVSVAKQRAETEAESAVETVESQLDRREDLREERRTVEAAIEELESNRADRREDRVAKVDTREELLDRFDDAPIDPDAAADYLATQREEKAEIDERVATLRTQLETAREALEEAEALQAAGKCPTCGQPIDESPHVDAIGDRRDAVASIEESLVDAREERSVRSASLESAETYVEWADSLERIEDDIDRIDERIETIDESIEDKEDRLEEIDDRLTTVTETIEQERETRESAKERVERAQDRLSELEDERSTIESRLETLQTLEEVFDSIESAQESVEQLRERRDRLADLNDERRERLRELRDRKRSLDEEFDPERVEKAKSDLANAREFLERVEEELESVAAEEAELRDRIGGIRRELSELESLRERRESVNRRLSAVETLYEETERLETIYSAVRSELRQQNVETLDRMVNETFDLIYQNDSYDHITVTEEYELLVFQKDGEELRPEQLSGGERALFNLSLRCGIYRLLAEGIDGTAPLPPLILDEPTVFLDAGHVTKLVDLVEAMRDIGVEQILLVTHDEELINAAEDLVVVEKDPTTNRSTISRSVPNPAQTV